MVLRSGGVIKGYSEYELEYRGFRVRFPPGSQIKWFLFSPKRLERLYAVTFEAPWNYLIYRVCQNEDAMCLFTLLNPKNVTTLSVA
jgi:hypothetical protein